MYKTRSKQGIEGKWGDLSNVFKTTEKQDTEGNLGHFANGPMTIGKSDFEIGMNNYVQKWKTAEIYRRNHDCGATPPQGECWIGINPPILSTNNKVTGATTNILRNENRKK